MTMPGKKRRITATPERLDPADLERRLRSVERELFPDLPPGEPDNAAVPPPATQAPPPPEPAPDGPGRRIILKNNNGSGPDANGVSIPAKLISLKKFG